MKQQEYKFQICHRLQKPDQTIAQPQNIITKHKIELNHMLDMINKKSLCNEELEERVIMGVEKGINLGRK